MVTISILDENFTAYNNIPLLCQARGIELDNFAEYDIQTFNTKRITGKHFIINGSKNNIKYSILMIPSGSDTYRKGNLEKVLRQFSGSSRIIIIKHSSVTVKYEAYNNVETLDFDIYLLTNFVEYIAYHGTTVRKISDDEFQKNYSTLYVTKESLPPLPRSTQECVWFDFECGDVIEICYPTMASSMKSGELRICE